MRVCGILGIPPREGEVMFFLRLAPADVEGEPGPNGAPLKPGLYSCCKDAFIRFAPRVIARLQRTQAIDGDGRRVWTEDGKPVMVLPEGATLDTVAHNLLM
jgi:hypothetical protein